MKDRHDSPKINRKEFRKKQEYYAEKIRSYPGRDDSVLQNKKNFGIYPCYALRFPGFYLIVKRYQMFHVKQ